MYLETAHKVCPIDFKKLKNASDGDLAHDVAGIIANLNFEMRKIENNFIPRCVKMEEAFFEHMEDDKFIHGDYYFDAKTQRVGILLEKWDSHRITSSYIGFAENSEVAQKVIEAFEGETEFAYDGEGHWHYSKKCITSDISRTEDNSKLMLYITDNDGNVLQEDKVILDISNSMQGKTVRNIVELFESVKVQIDEIIEYKNVLSIDIESKDARYASLELGNNAPQTLFLQPEL